MSLLPSFLRPYFSHSAAPAHPSKHLSGVTQAKSSIDLLTDAALPWFRGEGGPIKLKALDDYFKMAGAQTYERSAINRSFPMKTVISNASDIRGGQTLSLQNLKLLVALYVSVCQERAYQRDTSELDLDGFSKFLAARFRMSPGDVRKLADISAPMKGGPSPNASEAVAFAKLLRTDDGVAIGKINMSGQEICRKGFESAYLVKAELDFCGRSYDQADFRGATLDGAHLKNGVMKNAVFGHSSMVATHFDGMIFEGCTFPASVNLEDAIFTDCKFVNCKFNRCNMNGVTLHSGEVSNTRFTLCQLKKAKLGNDSDAQASTDRVLRINDNTKFESCNLEKMSVKRVAFDQASFEHSVMTSADVSHSDLIDSGLWMCQMADARFKEVKMPEANCVGADFDNANFDSCDLTDARFDFTHLTGTRLTENVTLKGTSFGGSSPSFNAGESTGLSIGSSSRRTQSLP